MRYLITVVHDGPEPLDVPAELYEAMGAYVSKLTADGVLLDGAGLAPIEKAKRIHLRGGAIEVVDGPFAETKEWVGGYFLVKVDSEEEAIEVARGSIELHRDHFPGFDVSHEIRRIMEE
jgi:hypothetical protein